MTPQAAQREKRESEKMKSLEELDKHGSLTQNSVTANRQKQKEQDKARKDTLKSLCHGSSASKRKAQASATTVPPNGGSNNTIRPVQQTVRAKTTRTKASRPKEQGGRRVPIPSDPHGCAHSGLLELLAVDKPFLKHYTKEGGWLHGAPCKDCATNKEEGDTRVMDVADLLHLKGRGSLGVCCNYGPVGHKMNEDEEPERKRQWTCDMILCMGCFSKREKGTEDSTAKRSRRGKRND